MNDQFLLDKLKDLHKQATEERSHYYTGKLILQAIESIEKKEKILNQLRDFVEEEC